MPNRSWLRQLCSRLTRRHQLSADRQLRDDLFPTLSVTRLEKRLVLNADAVPVAVPVAELVVDAGAAANDGQADTLPQKSAQSHLQKPEETAQVRDRSAGQLGEARRKGEYNE